MSDEAVDKARAKLVHTISRTSIGDDDWKIGDISAELIADQIEALIDAKLAARVAPAKAAGAYAEGGMILPIAEASVPAAPAGYTPVDSVPRRGMLPPDLAHDTHVEVIYRDGIPNKPGANGKPRVTFGEASLFNWKHAGRGTVLVDSGKTNADGTPIKVAQPGIVGNPDDDVIGYRLIPPPENKMSFKQAAGAA